MQALPTILLKPGEADRIIAGHPWVYHGSILRLTQPATDGELVQVRRDAWARIGVDHIDALFADVPADKLRPELPDLPRAKWLNLFRASTR